VTIPDATDSTLGALTVLRERVTTLRLPLELANATNARKLRKQIAAQLDDYVLPRMARLDAPLLAVVGGSTGAGKSTLVNAIVGRAVSQTGVLRPTTRAPLLAYHPDDAEWFTSGRILPDLSRVSGDGRASAGALRLVSDPAVPAGLALLDAPDVDSVVTENRELAAQLLKAADLWIFVTTAARYADAVPWDFLHDAAQRSAAVAVVLDRVHPEAVDEVRQHLAAMLDNRGLGDSPMFVIEESHLDADGLLPVGQVEPIRTWLTSLAADLAARTDVVKRTLDGAVGDVMRRMPALAEAADSQATMADQLRAAVLGAYDEALASIDKASRDGSLLRGEVLARWQDFVGTGEFFRSLEERVGRVRDRIVAFLRARPQPAVEVEQAIEHGLQALLVDEADRAAELADGRWRADPAGKALLGKDDLSRSSPEIAERAAEHVREWQGGVLDLVRTEGQDKRLTARMLSFGVNGLGVALMVVVFASTGGLTGAEVGIAGGTAVVGQRLLEAVFGDQAVRRLADAARKDLRERAEALLSSEAARFTDRLDVLVVDAGASAALREAIRDVDVARQREARS
jgi:energy-coupling factor transporter ATP-binding protein EcfA2